MARPKPHGSFLQGCLQFQSWRLPKPWTLGKVPQTETRKERSIAGQPKTANVNSDVSQSVEIGKLNYMASDKMIDPRLCFCLNISKMHV